MPGSIDAVLKLITSMKNVINWKTMSRIGVKLGSAEMLDRARFQAMSAHLPVFRQQRLWVRMSALWSEGGWCLRTEAAACQRGAWFPRKWSIRGYEIRRRNKLPARTALRLRT